MIIEVMENGAAGDMYLWNHFSEGCLHLRFAILLKIFEDG
jgi:hypothetical protein